MDKAARWGLVLIFVVCSVRFVAGFLGDLSGPMEGSIFLCLPIAFLLFYVGWVRRGPG